MSLFQGIRGLVISFPKVVLAANQINYIVAGNGKSLSLSLYESA